MDGVNVMEVGLVKKYSPFIYMVVGVGALLEVVLPLVDVLPSNHAN